MNSPIDTVVTAETPEGISISIRPAGFAARATAFLIDALIRFAVLALCSSVFALGHGVGLGLYLIVAFVVNWLYSVGFELSAAAATPGKRALGLYVLMANGLPITPAACLIRNLLRVVDMLPMLYGFAIVCVLLRRDARRLGDLAAGTIVAYRHEVELTGGIADGVPTPPPHPLTKRQQLAVTAFAWRADRLTPERAEEIASYAASAIGGTPLAARLIGIARWLHGDRPPRRTLAADKLGAPPGLPP